MGFGYEFETDKTNNREKNISMKVKLYKTCYSPWKIIEGNIIIKGKEDLKETNLSDTFMKMRLYEKQSYIYNISDYNYQTHKIESKTVEESEGKDINIKTFNFSDFKGKDLKHEIIIPFQFQVPENASPSLYISDDSTTYIKHYLFVDFPSIKAFKTNMIIVKNNIKLPLQKPLHVQKIFRKKNGCSLTEDFLCLLLIYLQMHLHTQKK